jgi:ADP-ribose pyrophosphatase YjhB (NUDIX family)
MSSPQMNFCSVCGAKVTLRVPPGDSLPRHVCDSCHTVHYRNPLVVVGTIPEWEDQILLCRRAIEPRHGLWTLPAGFMELGETTAQAALRETMEEAKARVDLGEVFAFLSVPHVDQVHVFYRARLLDREFAAGEETLEVALFRESEIPWKEIAFRTVSTALRHFYADRKAGAMRFHSGEILPLK